MTARLGWSGAGLSVLAVASGAVMAHAATQGLPVAFAVALAIAILAIAATARKFGQHASAHDQPTGEDWYAINARLHRMTLLVEHVPVPLVVVDDALQVTAVNRAARSLFGAERIVPRPPPEFLAAIGDRFPARHIVLQTGAFRTTFRLTVCDLSELGDDRRLVMLNDAQLDMGETDPVKVQQLLEILGHEIMNGVAPMVSLAETADGLLAVGDPVTDQAKTAIGTLARRAASLRSFCEAFRQFVHLPPPEFADCDMHDVMLDLELLFDHRWAPERIALQVRKRPVDGAVWIDHGQIVQALWAVLQNAAEAVMTNPPGDRRILLELDERERAMVVRISDNGPGLTLSHDRYAFEPFVSDKKGGAGVGLSIAQQIVHAHDGEIVITNNPAGRGAIVEVTL